MICFIKGDEIEVKSDAFYMFKMMNLMQTARCRVGPGRARPRAFLCVLMRFDAF